MEGRYNERVMQPGIEHMDETRIRARLTELARGREIDCVGPLARQTAFAQGVRKALILEFWDGTTRGEKRDTGRWSLSALARFLGVHHTTVRAVLLRNGRYLCPCGEGATCAACRAWEALSPQEVTIIAGQRWLLLPGAEGEAANGLGGTRRDVEYFTGRRMTCYNCWWIGPVPAKFRPQFPDNARWLRPAGLPYPGVG